MIFSEVIQPYSNNVSNVCICLKLAFLCSWASSFMAENNSIFYHYVTFFRSWIIISSLGKLSALRYESPSGPTAGLGKRISDHPTKWWYSCGRGLRNRAAAVQSESRSPFALSLEDLGPLNLSCFPLFTPSSSLHTLVYLVAKITSLLAPSLQFRQYFLPRRTVQSTPPRSVSLRV